MGAAGMSRWANRVALVTGASAGIGSAISKALVQHGVVVIGCARNQDAIQGLVDECHSKRFPGKLIPIRCDVSNERDIDKMFKWIETNYRGVDICVNNAGFSSKETLLGLTGEQMRAMLDVNVVGLALCSSRAANSMLSRGINDGHIFNINSMSGHRITGMMNFYAATKFAVTALTEGLRRELAVKSRIRVTAISPAMVETDFVTRALGDENGKEVIQSVGNLLKTQDIVDALIYALSAPESTQISDILIRPTGNLL